MRLAECCYRLNKIDEGLNFIKKIEVKTYSKFLMQGKFNDLQKKFEDAAENFEEALSLYLRDVKDQDKSVTGNIQFRLGWALIRSRKDIDSGISHLKEANAMLKDNFDIKFKLA
jgi:tetratricopeptide (TPR) repeat protein